MINIGLYFGTFNPVHIGHINIANYILNNTSLDKVWIVPSPLSPFKITDDILDFSHRLKMLEIATRKIKDISICDIEKNLPKPNYTINTLNALKEKYPDVNFNIIMGSDNIDTLYKWKKALDIIKNYNIYVYPRNNVENKVLDKNIIYLQAPIYNMSSSKIRSNLNNKELVKEELDPLVLDYITNTINK